MATDLTTVTDHPANVLATCLVLTPGARKGSSEVLREYEAQRGVTFAALDNGSLADVRSAYRMLYGASGLTSQPDPAAVRDLASALEGLLGLDEETA